jgi:hypothetical protein
MAPILMADAGDARRCGANRQSGDVRDVARSGVGLWEPGEQIGKADEPQRGPPDVLSEVGGRPVGVGRRIASRIMRRFMTAIERASSSTVASNPRRYCWVRFQSG